MKPWFTSKTIINRHCGRPLWALEAGTGFCPICPATFTLIAVGFARGKCYFAESPRRLPDCRKEVEQ